LTKRSTSTVLLPSMISTSESTSFETARPSASTKAVKTLLSPGAVISTLRGAWGAESEVDEEWLCLDGVRGVMKLRICKIKKDVI